MSHYPYLPIFIITDKVNTNTMPTVARETKQVRIMRIPEGGDHLPNEVLNDAKMKLSSVLVHQRPYRGLSQEEERKLLPEIIGVSPDDNDFSERARKYWAELTIDVPQEGHQLNVPVYESGEIPDPQDPHVEDWIKYQWAKDHPQVAKSRQEAEANINKRFFIYDPEREAKRENKESKMRQKAYIELAKASENEQKMDVLVRVLTDQKPEKLSNTEKENVLDTKVNSDPEEFISAATDDNLAIRGAIMDAVEHEVLNKIGNQIMYQDEVIADSMDEAIAWFKNDRNSGTVQEIKAKLDEAKR